MQTINISTSTILRITFVILALIFVWAVWDVLAVLFLAIIIASVVEPIASGLDRYRIPRFVSVSTIFLAILILFSLTFYFIVPPFIEELKNFTLAFPSLYEELMGNFQNFQSISQQSPQVLSDVLSRGTQELTSVTSNIFSFASALFGGIILAFLLFALSFYLLLKKDGIRQVLDILTPPQNKEYVFSLWARAQRKMRGWLGGRILSAILVGGLVYIGLQFLGVRYALSIAIITAVLEIIPFVGPFIAGAIAVLIASLQSFGLAFIVLALYVVIQQIDGFVITPPIMGKTTGLNPVVIILALLVGAKLGGILGILISIPAAAILMEFLYDLKKK